MDGAQVLSMECENTGGSVDASATEIKPGMTTRFYPHSDTLICVETNCSYDAEPMWPGSQISILTHRAEKRPVGVKIERIRDSSFADLRLALGLIR